LLDDVGKPRCALDGRMIAALGCLFGILSLIAGFYLPQFMQQQLDDQHESDLRDFLTLDSRTAPGLDAWVSSEAPGAAQVELTAWVYNITNPWEVLAGHKPLLQEVGPFVYKRHRLRSALSWPVGGNGTTMRYNESTWYSTTHSSSPSGRGITTINLAYQALLAWLGPAAAHAVARNASYTNGNELDWYRLIFSRRSVEEQLWGWGPSDDDLLEAALHMHPELPRRIVAFCSNDSAAQPMEIATGSVDEGQMRQLVEWRGQREVQCSTAPQKVEGSLGEQWSPSLSNASGLRIWMADKQRSLALVASAGPSQVQHSPEGLQTIRHVTVDEQRQRTALYNISGCSDGVPLAITAPHFFNTPASVVHGVRGVPAANVESDGSYWDVELESGSTLHAAERRQSNVWVRDLAPGLPSAQRAAVLVPLAWGQEVLLVSNNTGIVPLLLQHENDTELNIVRYGCLLVGGGLILLATAFALAVRNTEGGFCQGTQQIQRAMSPLHLTARDGRSDGDGYAARARGMSCDEVQKSFGHEDDFARHMSTLGTPQQPSCMAGSINSIRNYVASFSGAGGPSMIPASGEQPTEDAMAAASSRDSNEDDLLLDFEPANGQPSIGKGLGMLDQRLLQSTSPEVH